MVSRARPVRPQPVGPPPPGKQYTRCVCNCLLIHNAGASAISCPRETCKRTTILGPPPKGKARGVCPHCEKLMQWPERAKGIVRCPKCRHAAAVSHSFLRGRFLLHFVIGLILLGTGIGVTVRARLRRSGCARAMRRAAG